MSPVRLAAPLVVACCLSRWPRCPRHARRCRSRASASRSGRAGGGAAPLRGPALRAGALAVRVRRPRRRPRAAGGSVAPVGPRRFRDGLVAHRLGAAPPVPGRRAGGGGPGRARGARGAGPHPRSRAGRRGARGWWRRRTGATSTSRLSGASCAWWRSDGRATIEALSQAGRSAAPWERAGELPIETYLTPRRPRPRRPAVAANFPAQAFDPNEVGPRRAVAPAPGGGRGGRWIQALRGAPYDEIRALVADVLEFARTAPLMDEVDRCRRARSTSSPRPSAISRISPLRALRMLKEVALVACEDTAARACSSATTASRVPVTSYFEHNKRVKGEAILRALRDGRSVALVTDAGTPASPIPASSLVRTRARRASRSRPFPAPPRW